MRRTEGSGGTAAYGETKDERTKDEGLTRGETSRNSGKGGSGGTAAYGETKDEKRTKDEERKTNN